MVHESRVPRGKIEFISCTIERTEYSGLYCAWNPGGDLKVRFDGCRWNGVARKRTEPPMEINLVGAKSGPGLIVFDDCLVFDDRDREGIKIYGLTSELPSYGISGELVVVNKSSTKRKTDSTPEKTQLRLRYQGE